MLTRNTQRLASVAAAAALAASAAVAGSSPAAAAPTYTKAGPLAIGGGLETSYGSGLQIKDAVGSTPTASEPYGSVAPVSGLVGTVTSVTLRLKGFTHPAPIDVDVMLVSPSGERSIVMSDAGGYSASNVDLTLDDAAGQTLPEGTTLVTGAYRPWNYGQTDSFPAPAPSAAGAASALNVFNGIEPNGSWRLYLVDDAQGFTGSIAGWELTVRSTGAPQSLPSTLTVTGAGTQVTDVDVRLSDLSHGYPEDIDLLLVGPHGQQAMVLSDVGETSEITDLDLVLDDEAPAQAGDPLVSSTYRPTNSGATPDVIGDGPTITGQSALSVFDGRDPNGTWSLWIVDDAEGDRGSLGSWSLDITTTGGPAASPSPTPTAGIADTVHPKVGSTAPARAATGVRRGADVTAKLSEAVRRGTVTRASAYLVRKGTTRHVPATVTWEGGTRRIVIDPATRLRAGTAYRAVVTTAVKDLTGNRLDQNPTRSGLQPKTWRFTTR